MTHNLVVLLEDGRRLKGKADFFDPEKPFLLLRRVDMAGKTAGFIDVEMEKALAVFFVRDLALDRTSRRTAAPAAGEAEAPEPAGGASLRVKLRWGEVLDGLAWDYDETAPWFFLHPTGFLNRADNNERIWLTRKAVAEVEVLAAPRV